MIVSEAGHVMRACVLVAAALVIGHGAAACDGRGDAGNTVARIADEERGGSALPDGEDDARAPASPGGPTAPQGGAGGAGGAGKPPALPEPDLYDPAIIPRLELTFDTAAMAVLSNPDPATKETWVHASFKMGDITFADVGVRRKGSYSYRVLPQKASLKIKLNKWVKGQKVHGLTDLTLNNMVRGPTFLSERLSFYVFRAVGLPAQRVNTAHLTINGEDYGIYANVETPNRQFLERVLGTKAKTLYEGNWGGEWMPGKEHYFEIDVADPEAPAGTRPDLTSLFQAVAAADPGDLLAGVAAHLHTEEWLRFAAAEAVTAQRDGYAYGDNGSHNYFVAGDVDGKFWMMPWSLDTALSDNYGFVDASSPLNDTLFTRCKLGAKCWSAYKAEMKSVLDTFEKLDLVNLAKKWNAQIDALARSDPKRETTIAGYEERTRKLYAWLAARPPIVRAQLGL